MEEDILVIIGELIGGFLPLICILIAIKLDLSYSQSWAFAIGGVVSAFCLAVVIHLFIDEAVGTGISVGAMLFTFSAGLATLVRGARISY